jgi:hypothetical protein
VDRVGYDFQAAGEYVLLRSPDGAVEIQARQVPIPGSAHVTRNTAVAARVNGRRVAIHTAEGADPPLRVLIDGSVVDASQPIDLGSGARVAAYDDAVEVGFPDGTKLWAISISAACCINVMLSPSEALARDGAGLLGNVAAGGARLPALPDGTRLPRVTNRHDEFVAKYQRFGPAWLVTDETTLFDYAAGESRAGFVLPDFPKESEVRSIEDIPAEKRREAEAVCAEVRDEQRLEECVFDYSITNLVAFAQLYARTFQFEQQGPVAIGAPAPAPPPPPPDELPQGFVRVPTPSPVETVRNVALAADGRLFATVWRADGTAAVLAVDTAAGRVIAEVTLESANRVEVTADSVWVGGTTATLTCVIARFDHALAPRATIEVPCDVGGPAFGRLGDTVWFLDRTTADADARNGHLRRIDPATNAVGENVGVPFVNGHLISGDGALLWHADPVDAASPEVAVYRLEEGSTALESLGRPDGFALRAGGRGVWSQGDRGIIYREDADEVPRTFGVNGTLVAADATGAYVAGASGFDGTPELSRYGVDGTEPVVVARGVTLDTSAGSATLGYGVDAPLAVGGGRAAQLWLVPTPDDPARKDLVLQVVQVP